MVEEASLDLAKGHTCCGCRGLQGLKNLVAEPGQGPWVVAGPKRRLELAYLD